MSSRGILQIKKIKLAFCDWGGSSNGVRQFFKNDEFYNFVNSNPTIDFEFLIRRGRHPFIRAIYANGWHKDLPLRNFNEESILNSLKLARSNCKKT
jgi:large subunit ribosomal protein L43